MWEPFPPGAGLGADGQCRRVKMYIPDCDAETMCP